MTFAIFYDGDPSGTPAREFKLILGTSRERGVPNSLGVLVSDFKTERRIYETTIEEDATKDPVGVYHKIAAIVSVYMGLPVDVRWYDRAGNTEYAKGISPESFVAAVGRATGASL